MKSMMIGYNTAALLDDEERRTAAAHTQPTRETARAEERDH